MKPALSRTGALLFAGAAVAACSSAAHAGSPSSSRTASLRSSSANAFSRFAPAAQGEIAQISGHTLQVQSSTDQTAVTYSAKTKFTAEHAVTLAAVTVGSCVVATSSSTSSGSASTTITATTVRITAAVNGSCTAGFGGRAGTLPNGARPTGTRPSGLPAGARPNGFPTGARRAGFGGGLAGKVTAISGSTLTVQLDRRTGTSGAAPSVGTVHVTSATKYATTGPATAAALEVGLCAVVTGTTDSTGAVAASRIALTQQTNGSCTTGFLGRTGGNG